MRIGRNDPCHCGSGLKFKKCCWLKQSASPSQTSPQISPVFQEGPSPVEPYLYLVPSVVWNGHRWRAIWNKIHYRPLTETFHEFLIGIVRSTLGQAWWKHQIKMEESKRHVVVRWANASSRFKATNIGEEYRVLGQEYYSASASGPIWALLTFGYDLFCLQAKNVLPEFLIKRLQSHRDFQAARYEIIAAAIMARAGFEISYLDDKVAQQRHCEFIAQHKETGVEIGVEAKSRVRQGALNAVGEFNYTQDWKGIYDLIRTARKQKPDGLPFFIFVDVNLPPSPNTPLDKKPWTQDLRNALRDFGAHTEETPDPFNALIATNFAYYYGDENEKPSPGEWSFIVPQWAKTLLPDPKVLNVVEESVARYGWIPAEV